MSDTWSDFIEDNPDRVAASSGGASSKAGAATVGSASKRGSSETLANTGEGKAPKQTEHDIQAALFELAAYKEGERPALALLYATPNGQYRPGQRQEPGLKAGIPDMTLPVPSRCGARFFHGLYLELKRKDGHLRPQQRMWLRRLRAAGYAARVAWGYEEAWTTICDYLDGTLGPPEEI